MQGIGNLYIHKLRKGVQVLKKMSDLIWTVMLLLYSILILIALVLEISAIPSIFFVFFYIFVPGYALTFAVLYCQNKLETIILSIGMSLALFTGIRGLIQLFGFASFFSDKIILSIFSVIILTMKTFFRSIRF